MSVMDEVSVRTKKILLNSTGPMDEIASNEMRRLLSEVDAGPNLHQRINAVRADVKYVQRGSAGQGKGALYADVVRKARVAMIEHGVMFYPIGVKVLSQSVREDGKTTSILCEYLFAFVNADNPNERIETPVLSHGLDNSDKSPGKAATYSAKYALIHMLNLEMGDDPDADEFDPDVEPERAEMIAKARKLTEEINPDDPTGEMMSLLAHLGEKYTRKVRTVFAVPMDVWPYAIGILEKKAASQ